MGGWPASAVTLSAAAFAFARVAELLARTRRVVGGAMRYRDGTRRKDAVVEGSEARTIAHVPIANQSVRLTS